MDELNQRFSHIERHVDSVVNTSLPLFQKAKGWENHGIIFSVVGHRSGDGLLQPVCLGPIRNVSHVVLSNATRAFGMLCVALREIPQTDPPRNRTADYSVYKDGYPIRASAYSANGLIYMCAGAPPGFNLVLTFMAALWDSSMNDAEFDHNFKAAEQIGGDPFRRVWNQNADRIQTSAVI